MTTKSSMNGQTFLSRTSSVLLAVTILTISANAQWSFKRILPGIVNQSLQEVTSRIAKAKQQQEQQKRLAEQEEKRRQSLAKQQREQDQQAAAEQNRQERENRIGEASELMRAAEASYQLDDHVVAQRLYLQALEIYQRVGDNEGMATARRKIGEIRVIDQDYTGAIAILEGALTHYRTRRDRENLGVTNHLLGLAHLKLKQLDKSFDYLQSALESAYLNPNNKEQLSLVLYSLGVLQHEKGQRQQAIETLTRSLRVISEYNGIKPAIEVLGTLAGYYEEERNFEKATICLNSLLEVTRENDVPRYVLTLIRLAKLNFETRDLNEATVRLNEALRVSTQRRDTPATALIHQLLGQLYIAKGNRLLARQHLESALALFRELNDSDGEAAVLERMKVAEKMPVTESQSIAVAANPPVTVGNAPSRPGARPSRGRLKPTPMTTR